MRFILTKLAKSPFSRLTLGNTLSASGTLAERLRDVGAGDIFLFFCEFGRRVPYYALWGFQQVSEVLANGDELRFACGNRHLNVCNEYFRRGASGVFKNKIRLTSHDVPRCWKLDVLPWLDADARKPHMTGHGTTNFLDGEFIISNHGSVFVTDNLEQMPLVIAERCIEWTLALPKRVG